jgi:hypothetical protein
VTLRPKTGLEAGTRTGREKSRKAIEALRVPEVEPAPATDTEPRGDTTMKRVNWLPAPHFFNLNMACVPLNDAFESGFGCYLVGSCLKRRDYRDVDVRMIVSDDEWARLFGTKDVGRPDMNPFWSVLCSSVSLWLSKQSGLPVDFQIQQQTMANKEFSREGGHARHPLGILMRPNPRDYAASEAAGDKP